MSHQILFKRNQFIKKSQDPKAKLDTKDTQNDPNENINSQKAIKIIDMSSKQNTKENGYVNNNNQENKDIHSFNEDLILTNKKNITRKWGIKPKINTDTKIEIDAINKMRTLINNHDQNGVIRRPITKTSREESSASKSNDTCTPEKSSDRYSLKVSPIKPVLFDSLREQINKISINTNILDSNNTSNILQAPTTPIDSDGISKSFESRLKRFNTKAIRKAGTGGAGEGDIIHDPMYSAKPKPPCSNSKTSSSFNSSDIDMSNNNIGSSRIHKAQVYDYKNERINPFLIGLNDTSALENSVISSSDKKSQRSINSNRKVKLAQTQILSNILINDNCITFQDDMKPPIKNIQSNALITEILDKETKSHEIKPNKRVLDLQLPKPLIDLKVCLSSMDSTERATTSKEDSGSNITSKSGSGNSVKGTLNKEYIENIKDQMKNRIPTNQGNITTVTPILNANPLILNGASSLLNGNSSAFNGTSSTLNGASTILNGTSSVLNGASSILNGTSSVLNGNSSILNGTSSLLNTASPTLNGVPFNPSANLLEQYTINNNNIKDLQNIRNMDYEEILLTKNNTNSESNNNNTGNNNNNNSNLTKSKLSFKVISEKYFDNTVYKLQKVKNIFYHFKEKQDQINEIIKPKKKPKELSIMKENYTHIPNQSKDILTKADNKTKVLSIETRNIEYDKDSPTTSLPFTSISATTATTSSSTFKKKYHELCQKNIKIGYNMLNRVFKKRIKFAYSTLCTNKSQNTKIINHQFDNKTHHRHVNSTNQRVLFPNDKKYFFD